MKTGALLLAVALWVSAPVLAIEADGIETIAGASGISAKLDRSPLAGADGKVDPKVFALGFYRDDAVLYEYKLGELVVKTDGLEVLPDGVRWVKKSEVNDDALHLETIDGQSYEFDIPTGEIRRLRKKYN